uniref:Cold shock domain containing E1, RNA-binding n=1 Tax=Eptatretus burgeri TaxID=7764 RepID=A0A8C4QDJ2_EPTBU
MSYDPGFPSNGHGLPGLRELGSVEKLMASYGFVKCYTRPARLFFHYSQFCGDVNSLKIGDEVEFETATDRKTGKPIAVNLVRMKASSPHFDSSGNERIVGQVVAPIPSRGREPESPSSLLKGSVCYERNGEVFYLNFAHDDVEGNTELGVGDKVSFVLSNKSSGFLGAQEVRLQERKRPDRYHGVVCAMKETFGFIERADQVKEIFFHYSEFRDNLDTLEPGDDVEFGIQERNGKEVAVDVKLLPEGTVVFEDVSIERYEGYVTQALPKAVSKAGSEPLPGRIRVSSPGPTGELPFGEKDPSSKATLLPGDHVAFQLSTDRRDGLQRATAIELLPASFANSQEKREMGVVAALRDGFGFIKCVEREPRMFFHFSEVLDGANSLHISDEVEFTIAPVPKHSSPIRETHLENPTFMERDAKYQDALLPQRNHAIRIVRLPRGSVVFSTVLESRCVGIVEQEAVGPSGWNSAQGGSSPGRGKEKDSELGIILFDEDDEQKSITFHLKDIESRIIPKCGDKVEFSLVEMKRSGQRSAVGVRVLGREAVGRRSSGGRQMGFIATLKDTFGFIENAQHTQEIFFHYSEFSGDVSALELGDAVEFSLGKPKGNKISAERVAFMNPASVPHDEVAPTIYLGRVVRPLRSVDPQQSEYQGLIEITEDGSLKGEKFPYGVLGLATRADIVQRGESVKLQLCTTASGGITMATNITPMRTVEKALVDSVKGEFGFLAFEVSEGKKLFFHQSEVQGGHELQPGDEVEFSVVQNPKSGKASACSIRRINEAANVAPAPRPERLVNRLRSLTLDDSNAPRLVITRNPRGPDGTRVSYHANESCSHVLMIDCVLCSV